MEIKLLLILGYLCADVLAYDYTCQENYDLATGPFYDFSVNMLQRINEYTDSHFVYSPMSTWLELSALADGATGTNLEENLNVTNNCSREKLGDILNKLWKLCMYEIKRQPVIAIDRLIKVKKSYIQEIQRLYGIKVMLLNFNDNINSANAVNNVIERGTGGVIDNIVYYDDFKSSVLVICDANYFRSQWKTSFNIASTTLQSFFSSRGDEIGKVSMMNQVGNFHLTYFPFLRSRVLEIPFATRRIVMLIISPTGQLWFDELFYRLRGTKISSIFNMYKRAGTALVNVTMPRFNQRTDVDNLPELLYDMGIKKIFEAKSKMAQITRIEINERGIKAAPNFLVKNKFTAVEFLVNKPFVYMIVDRETDAIILAGVYSRPDVSTLPEFGTSSSKIVRSKLLVVLILFLFSTIYK